MNPQLPKALAAAVEIAKSLSAKIDEFAGNLATLKASLEEAHPVLAQVHKNIVAGEPAFDVPDVPAETTEADEPPDEPGQPRGEHGRFV
jgi:hypothetical protein